ncbi:NEL-type E3 ubiquitin ligase domain-containing protein [Pseudomonas xantholysinigenes]|uniref:RING-type E3 ubiquitin transferase n=1 Tax=Pseudomonas xantholysinigenes TaxID=2745490 RepID=A0A9E6TW53_9PSED|nr:NEL-type E3 ubiquitin ligase domain-containing protein [Pseudomonas xantholysinigenes]QXI36846.1 hypothetical protein HU772_015995 [Pseudomonas xantholysinigenes]
MEKIIDAFIHKRLPQWLKDASAEDIGHLKTLMARHQATQDALSAATASALPVKMFATQAFAAGLASLLPVNVKLEDLDWRTKVRSIQGASTPHMEDAYRVEPGLQRLMQGFAEGATPLEGSGLALRGTSTIISGDLTTFIKRCRTLDVGAQYQTLLKDTFRHNAALLINDKQAGFLLAVHVAYLKNIIDGDVKAALEHATIGTTDAKITAYPGLLSMLGTLVHDALFVQLRGDDDSDKGVVVYIPSDRGEPLRWYGSKQDCVTAWVEKLRQKEALGALIQLIGVQDRSAFFSTLQLRLQDAQPDLELKGRTGRGHIFERWAYAQITRVEEDAKLMLVPVAQADAAASRERWQLWRSMGWDVAALAGFFIPAVGAVMLAQLVVQVCGQVYEGVSDWAKGHDHEALGHALNVAETVAAVAVTTGVAVGVGSVVRHFTRSAFVDGLESVRLDDGTLRLWNNDRQVYRSTLPEGAELGEDGLYRLEERRWIKVDDEYYEVHQPRQNGPWRLLHPRRATAYGPVVVRNTERLWQLPDEAPISWHDPARMLGRLWPQQHPLDLPRAQLLLRVACSDVEELRGILVDNRALPANLRETLRYFEANDRIDRFFASVRHAGQEIEDTQLLDWCRQRPEMAGVGEDRERVNMLVFEGELRQGLFGHLTAVEPAEDRATRLIVSQFPGLTADYATDLTGTLSVAERDEIELRRRLPLSVTTRARSLLQLARLCHAQQGLVLRNAYNDVTSEIVPFLLARVPNWPARPRLELRQGSWRGRLQAVINAHVPSDDTRMILVNNDGQFQLYDHQGDEYVGQTADTNDFFEAINFWLSIEQRNTLALGDAEQAAKLRQLVIDTLPEERHKLLALFGWRQQEGWFNPGQRLPDGRVGYLMGGLVSKEGGTRRFIRRRLAALYSGGTPAQIDVHLDRILDTEEPLAALESEENNFRLLAGALDSWVDEARERERPARRQFMYRLHTAWRRLLTEDQESGHRGFVLDLSGSTVTSLPELDAGIDFDHITTLVMVNTPLRAVPDSFFSCFGRLRRLNMSYNNLATVPTGLRHLATLERLRLTGNRIRFTAQVSDALAALTNLQELDLSLNPLRRMILRFDQVPALVRLRLSDCGLLNWPQGIEQCGMLCRVDLRSNNLSSVPDNILEMPYPFRSAIELDGNPIPLEQLTRLYAHPPHLAHPGQAANVQRLAERAAWVAADQEQVRGPRWDRLFADARSNRLKNLLGDLEHTTDYSNATHRAELTSRVWELLDVMDSDREMASTFFAMAREATTCDDSVANRFSELYLHLLKIRAYHGQGDEQAGLLTLGLGLFRLKQLEIFINEYIAERKVAEPSLDEVEVSLYIRIKLTEELELPGQPASMRYERLGHVEPTVIDDARAHVRARETIHAQAEYLSGLDFWSDLLRVQHRDEFDAIDDDFASRGAELEIGEEGWGEQWVVLGNGHAAQVQRLKMLLTIELLQAG